MTEQETSQPLPQSLMDAMKRKPPKDGFKAIKHVVLLMQENRSFDHYFGKDFRGVRGFSDRNAIMLRGDHGQDHNHTIIDQPDDRSKPVTYNQPFPLTNPAAGTDHDWKSGHIAWNNGWHDKWITAKGPTTMGYVDPEVVGTHRALADAFTICDAYHSSVTSETTSNRNYLFTGFGGWEPSGKRSTAADAHGREISTSYDPCGYNWTSYAEILEANNVSWRVYQGWDNFYDNNLEFHAEFKRIAHFLLDNTEVGGQKLSEKCVSLYDFYAHHPSEGAVKALNDTVTQLSPADARLYKRGLFRCPCAPTDLAKNPKKLRDFVYAFERDIKAGDLPQVSYLVTSETDSEHPGSTPTPGQEVVCQVLDAIASHKDTWESTVLLISYDENDGFFDHIPPPVPPPGVHDEFVDSQEFANSQPMGLGMRVPMIAVCPWTIGGYVNSQVFDHTSQVRFLERWLSVRQPAISRWRRTVAGDLMSVFDFDRTDPPPPQPPDPTRRLARALPYQPEAHGVLDPQKHTFRLHLSNTGTASAHLTLYHYSEKDSTPQHFDVHGTLADPILVSLQDERYDLVLTGPNGFRREFAGTTKERAAGIEVSTTIAQAPERKLNLTITSPISDPVTVILTPTFYSGAPPKKGPVASGEPLHLEWDTEDAQGWYDLTLTIDGFSYRRRLMGHIENGHESITG